MGTTFVTISVFMSQGPQVDPDPQNAVVAKTFAPRFCAEWSNREVRSLDGVYFRDHFCVYVSGPLSGNFRIFFVCLPG